MAYVRARDQYGRPDRVSWTTWNDEAQEFQTIVRSRLEINRDIVRNVLRTGHCADCGEADPVVLQFDHRDRENKSFTIAAAIGTAHPRELLDEIKKCDIRCANCHVRRTAKQFGWWRNDLEFATPPALTRGYGPPRLRVAVAWAPLGTGFRVCLIRNRWKYHRTSRS